MARRFWPDGNAVGHVLRRPDPVEADLLVIGVVSDVNIRSLGEAPRDVIYEHYAQADRLPAITFVARTTSDAGRMTQTLLAAGREVDPDLRVMQATTMAQHLAMSRLPSQIAAVLLGVFSVLGVALAAVGVYGMVRYTVSMRTREVGIRMALGADAACVARQLATHGVRLVLAGGAIGAVASLLAARFLATCSSGSARSIPSRSPAHRSSSVRGVAGCVSARTPREPREPVGRLARRVGGAAGRKSTGRPARAPGP
jgi:hypothetical protein